MDLTLFIPTKVVFGATVLNTLCDDVRNSKISKVGLVVDHNLAQHDLVRQIKQGLRDLEVVEALVHFAEPTYDDLETFRKPFMGSNIEAVIGVGGGSALDTAKAVAVLVNNLEHAISYRGFDKMTETVLPIYTVPTTAGTGSEITPNASFVDSASKKKLGINGEAIRPKGAYLHPGFIMTCPRSPATYAAIDALVHAVEAFAAQKSTPVARMFAREAVDLLLNNVEKAVIDKDEAAVEKVFLGSLLAGVAMMHSGTGPAAALSYPLGVHLKVPHGLAGGIFLPHIMRWNVERGYCGYGDLLPGVADTGDGRQRAGDMVARFFEVWSVLDIPAQAKSAGLKESDIDKFLVDLRELRGAIDQNPVAISDEDLRAILLAHL